MKKKIFYIVFIFILLIEVFDKEYEYFWLQSLIVILAIIVNIFSLALKSKGRHIKIKFSKNTMLYFLMVLFWLGAKIRFITQDGIGIGNDLVFAILLVFAFCISMVLLYRQAYNIGETKEA